MTHKLVPIEPTEEMIKAGIDVWKNSPLAVVTIFKAMLSAAPSGWMLIESAPKDGTDIIVFDYGWSETGIAHVFWDCEHWQVVGRDDITPHLKPTHWMPLPPAPEVV